MKNIFNQETRIVSRKSLNLLAVSVILMVTQATGFDEAVCKPRPATVAVSKDHDVVPYHIILYRCSGTCDNTSPNLKPCSPKDTQEIDLQVTGMDNKKQTIKVYNHTSCNCACKCKTNEILTDEDSCICEPLVRKSSRSKGKTNHDEPAKLFSIGIGLGSFFFVIFF